MVFCGILKTWTRYPIRTQGILPMPSCADLYEPLCSFGVPGYPRTLLMGGRNSYGSGYPGYSGS
eukprot:3908793-Rhodomonas_salina.1